MRFDDRLRTVLAQPASDPHDRAIRWRQLVELVARFGESADRDLLDEALDEIEAGCEAVGERVRSAAALAIAPINPPADLVAIFASDGIAVAAPLLASARLTASEWKHVSSAASEECRTFIAAMRSEQVSPPSRPPPGPAPESGEQPPHVPSIGEVVARIERLRQVREPQAAETRAATEAREEDEPSRLFRWECNEIGQIDWVEGVPRGPFIGRSIAQGDGGIDRHVERAFAAKAPFHEGMLDVRGAGTVAGAWKISGIPAFETASGRFAGYRGVAERYTGDSSGGASDILSNPTSLRELVHEVKTPLTAIIGFAEIISGEYFGPAEHKYRERASDIVAQARLLLGAIDDLDFAAKARSAGSAGKAQVDLGDLVERIVPSLRELAETHGVILEASRSLGELAVAVDPELAERLVSRMCDAIIERGAPGERLRLSLDNRSDHLLVSISLPAARRGLSEADLFAGADNVTGNDLRLRLVRGMSRVAGADIMASGDTLALAFPRG